MPPTGRGKHHHSLDEAAKIITSAAESRQPDKLLAELNSIPPKELIELTARLQKPKEKSNLQFHVTQSMPTGRGLPDQPVQLSFETRVKAKTLQITPTQFDHAQVFSYDVLKHKWYHSKTDDAARSIELSGAENNYDKVLRELNSAQTNGTISELERKLEEQAGKATLGNEKLPEVSRTAAGIGPKGEWQPIEITFANKTNYRVNVFGYDGKNWFRENNKSYWQSMGRLGKFWNTGFNDLMSDTATAFQQTGQGAHELWDFCPNMKHLVGGLNQMSEGASNPNPIYPKQDYKPEQKRK